MEDNNNSTETVESKEIDYKSLYEKTAEDLQKVVAKKEELLSETKKAKQERAEQLAIAQKAEQEKAKKDGEFEKLWQSSEERLKALEVELQKEKSSYRQEKIQTHAMKLAVELSDGDAQSAKLLSFFVQDKLSKLSGETGQLDDALLEAVRHEFKTNKDYSPLIGGSKASGGSAAGNTRGASNATKQMTQSEIDSYSPAEKVKLLSEGVKVIPNN